MRILIANDDGLDAEGIQTLASELATHYDVYVVAPDRNRSGASNSLTLTRPLTPIRVNSWQVRVDGTPTDCVNLALSGVFERQFDMVISGINHGPNLGDDVLYSGTVAAAMEARHLGRPAIAVSLVGNTHFKTAAQVVLQLLAHAQSLNLPAKSILNVNVPDVPFDDIKGIKSTRLGHRSQAQPAVSAQHPRGVESYWIGALSEPDDAGPDTDFYAVNQGWVSVTPLHADMTHQSVKVQLSQWLEGVLDT